VDLRSSIIRIVDDESAGHGFGLPAQRRRCMNPLELALQEARRRVPIEEARVEKDPEYKDPGSITAWWPVSAASERNEASRSSPAASDVLLLGRIEPIPEPQS
jgi:alpha-beta hydrolase superfamily lysophospholipase